MAEGCAGPVGGAWLTRVMFSALPGGRAERRTLQSVVFGGRQTSSAQLLSTTIRGRDGELGVLGEQLERVRSGLSAVVLIEGAAGMGKSRLMAEGMRMAHRLTLPVGLGVAEPSESVAE